MLSTATGPSLVTKACLVIFKRFTAKASSESPLTHAGVVVADRGALDDAAGDGEEGDEALGYVPDAAAMLLHSVTFAQRSRGQFCTSQAPVGLCDDKWTGLLVAGPGSLQLRFHTSQAGWD